MSSGKPYGMKEESEEDLSDSDESCIFFCQNRPWPGLLAGRQELQRKSVVLLILLKKT